MKHYTNYDKKTLSEVEDRVNATEVSQMQAAAAAYQQAVFFP